MNELTPDNGYISFVECESKVYTDILEFTKNLENNIVLDDENKQLPHNTAYPKFRKEVKINYQKDMLSRMQVVISNLLVVVFVLL